MEIENNIEEIKFKTWQECYEWIQNKKSDTTTSEHYGEQNQFLFRGHSCSTWKLETTLERNFGKDIPFKQYYKWISQAKPKIESKIDKKWDIPTQDEFSTWLNECRGDNLSFDTRSTPALDLMIYLRHHGYPSPLLDWSKSEYVAAFFAFRNSRSKNVSIYAYQHKYKSNLGGVNGTGIATIKILDAPQSTDCERHLKQKSAYTTAHMLQPIDSSIKSYYCSHELTYINAEYKENIIYKLNVPGSEKIKVLTYLNNDHNINAFSLFGSEESLCETCPCHTHIEKTMKWHNNNIDNIPLAF